MKHSLKDISSRIVKTNAFANFVNLSIIQVSNVVLMVLIIRIITRKVGIEGFGFYMLANTFALLSGIFINYGTSQSGIKDIAVAKDQPKELSRVFYNTLFIRILIFILFLVFIFFLQWMNIKYYFFLLLATPIVLAEVFNPLFFYLGLENLKIYNIANLVSKAISLLLIVYIIRGPDDSAWINFIMGMVSVVTYFLLLVHAVVKFRIPYKRFEKLELLKLGKDNFFLTGNNISVQLQQSLMVFALGKWGSASMLGAYSLCDRIMQAARLLISSISNAIYPKASLLYQESEASWKKFMKVMKGRITLLFLVFSLVLFFFSGFIIHFITGYYNPAAIGLLRIMAFIPTLAALNSFNVVDLLLKNNNVAIFRIAMILLVLGILLSAVLAITGRANLFGYYTLIIDFSALLLYEYAIKKSDAKHG